MSKDAFFNGVLAERIFIAEAMRFGLDISCPIVDRRGYDCIIHGKNKFHRIQIKSTSIIKGNGYRLSLAKGAKGKTLYTDKEIDYFACFVKPLNQWYIIPVSEVTTITNYLRANDPNHKYTKYLNAWHLLS